MNQENAALADRAAGPTMVRWHIIAILISFSFMTWFNRVSMSVAYDDRIKDQTGISEEAIGTVYSTFLLVYTLFMTPGGWVIDRFGPWKALVVMGLGSALFGALTSAAGLPAVLAGGLVLPWFLVIRSLIGLFTAPIYPAAGRLVSFWLPLHNRVLGNGLVQGAAAVGIACSFPIFGALMDWLDWPKAFLVSGGVTAVLALVWTVYGKNHPSEHRGVNLAERQLIERRQAFRPPEVLPPADWWSLARNRSLVLLTISYGAVGYMEYLFFFWMRYYMKDIRHISTEKSRVYSTILYLAMAGGMALGGWSADRLPALLGPRRGRALVPVAGMILGALFLLLGVFASETVWIVTWLALAIAAVGSTEAPIWTTAIEIGKHQGGASGGIVNTGGNAAALVAPIITPWFSHLVMHQFHVSEQAGWQWGICLASFISLSGACLWWWIDPAERVSELEA